MYERAKYKEEDWEHLTDPVGSVKHDGAHFFIKVEPDGSLRYFSRRESVKGGFPERTSQLPQLTAKKLPQFAGNVYSTELIHTGTDLNGPEAHNVLGGILNSLIPRSLATQAVVGPVRAVLLDVVEPKLETYKDKLNHLKEVEKAYGNSDVLKTVDVKIGHNAIREEIARTKANGQEGVIVTSLETPESKNIRFKVKHFNTYNLKIVGFEQERTQEGQLKNSLGALVLADRTGRVVGKVGTGFPRDLRRQIWLNQKSYLGELVQVRAVPSSNGNIRQPSFNGMADGEVDEVK